MREARRRPNREEQRCRLKSASCCLSLLALLCYAQVGVYVPLTRDAEGTRDIALENVVSRSTQADGINLHGQVTRARVENVHFANTGDDTFAVWGADRNASAIVWQSCVAVPSPPSWRSHFGYVSVKMAVPFLRAAAACASGASDRDAPSLRGEMRPVTLRPTA